MNVPPAIRWEDQRLLLLDQRALPDQVNYLEITALADAIDAIRTLAVRGAPAIGIAAAYALAASMREAPSAEFAARLTHSATALKAARPTAVNLAWAVDTPGVGKLVRANDVVPVLADWSDYSPTIKEFLAQRLKRQSIPVLAIWPRGWRAVPSSF